MRPIILGFAVAAFSVGVAAAQTTGGARAASGNDNQAVATTQANAPAPAKGSNSFTRGEAMRRLRSHGFEHVSDLRKDGQGVWRGVAWPARAAARCMSGLTTKAMSGPTSPDRVKRESEYDNACVYASL
jgi:hypothetical protein